MHSALRRLFTVLAVHLLFSLFVVSPPAANAQNLWDDYQVSGPTERIYADYTKIGGSTSANTFSGLVAVKAEGHGVQSPGEEVDAFWTYVPALNFNEYGLCYSFRGNAAYVEGDGRSVAERTVYIDGEGPVSRGAVPAYTPTHSYLFIMDVGTSPVQITLGGGDGGTWDNSGGINATLWQVEPHQRILKVKPTGDDLMDGETWASAKRTLQSALAAVGPGGEVWVCAGTYVEQVTFPSGVAVYGGFAGLEASREQRNWKKNVTVLEGSGGKVVTVPAGVTGATIDGFTVRKGTGPGAGVFCDEGASVTISHNIITACSGNDGVAIRCERGTVTVENNLIYGNASDGAGAGIAVLSGTASIRHNTIVGNTGAPSTVGAGVFVSRGPYPTGTSSVILTGNIIAFNSSAVYTYDTNALIAGYNCVFGNTQGDDLGLLAATGGIGNIASDPRLVDLAGRNLHLRGDSPCIDTAEPGDPGAPFSDKLDIDAQPRLSGSHFDIGADEFTTTSAYLTFDVQPLGAQAGKPFRQQPRLSVRNADNHEVASSFTGPVSLTLKAGAGPEGAILSGTTTVYAVNGIAVFGGLSLDKVGTGYVVTAYSDEAGALDSAVLDVAPTTPDAVRVYGQADMHSSYPNDGGVSPDSLAAPWGLALDWNGLYVADSYNNRVLFFPEPGTTARRGYGQTGLTMGDPNAGGLSAASLLGPTGVAVYQGGLYTADAMNNRVLYYPQGSVTGRRVFGQLGFTANSAPQTASATNLTNPQAVAADKDGLYVVDSGDAFGNAKNRVLFFPSGSSTATRVYGQPDMMSADPNNGGVSADSLRNPAGIAVASDGVYIADRDNNRVLFYDGTFTTASRVYGQPGFSSNAANNGGISARSLYHPTAVAVENGGVYIVDTGNHRVLFYAGTSTDASIVYGQPDFNSGEANIGSISKTSLCAPQGIAAGGLGVFIADTGNHRVLGFHCAPSGSIAFGDANADGALDVADVVRLLSVSAGLLGEADWIAGDIGPNYGPQGFGDGRIDLRDGARLIRHLGGLEAMWP